MAICMYSPIIRCAAVLNAGAALWLRRMKYTRLIGSFAKRTSAGICVKRSCARIAPRVPIRMVTASRGKVVRAEPIVAQYEQGKVHHCGTMNALEDQMTGWAPDSGEPSPDRIDALTWACTELSAAAADADQPERDRDDDARA